MVLNISITWKTEEVHAFHKFTSEQTQALILTHGLCLTEAWDRAVVIFVIDWVAFLSVIFQVLLAVVPQVIFLMPEKQFTHCALVTSLLLPRERQDVLVRIRNMDVERGNAVSLSSLRHASSWRGSRCTSRTKQALKAGKVKGRVSFSSHCFLPCLPVSTACA